MKIRNQAEYEKAIENAANLTLEDFKVKYAQKKHKDLFANGYLAELRQHYEKLEGTPEFGKYYNGIREIDDDAKVGQTYFDSIISYQKQSGIKLQEILDCLIAWNAVILAQKLVNNYLRPPVQNDFIEEPIEATEFTISRQVMAIKYLLDEIGIEQIDKTEVARFVQLITGRGEGTKRIQNTNIYKRVCQPLSTSNKHAEADLQYIRPFFEKLGFKKIVAKINHEIASK